MYPGLKTNVKTARKTAWSTAAFYERTFGILPKALKSRNVTPRVNGEVIEYEVSDFYEKCGDLLYKRLAVKYDKGAGDGADATPGQLKNALLVEQVRKLRLSNDEEERRLVSRDEVLPLYTRGMRAVVDKLDRIPTRIKIQAPDIPAAILTVVTECIAEARNEAARGELNI